MIAPPTAEIIQLMRNIAGSFAYTNKHLEADDVYSHLLLMWCEKYEDIEPFTSEDTRGSLLVAFRNWAIDFSRREARQRGIRPADTCKYTLAQIEECLPSIESPEYWARVGQQGFSDEIRSKPDPAHGNDALAMWADMRRAWESLAVSQRDLLRGLFVEGRSQVELARSLGVARSSLQARVAVALDAMRAVLGVRDEPVRRRRAMSNATAQVLTRTGVEGD